MIAVSAVVGVAEALHVHRLPRGPRGGAGDRVLLLRPAAVVSWALSLLRLRYLASGMMTVELSSAGSKRLVLRQRHSSCLARWPNVPVPIPKRLKSARRPIPTMNHHPESVLLHLGSGLLLAILDALNPSTMIRCALKH